MEKKAKKEEKRLRKLDKDSVPGAENSDQAPPPVET